MRLLRNLSIKRKLIVLAMVTSTVALLIACAACMAFDVLTFRERMTQDVRMYAQIVGANCTAALAFKNVEDARQTLLSLRADEHVVGACIYDTEGAPFAAYVRGQQAGDAPAEAGEPAGKPAAAPPPPAKPAVEDSAAPASATPANDLILAEAAPLPTMPGGDGCQFPTTIAPDSATFTSDHLDVFHTIRLDGNVVGTIFVRSDLDLLWARIERYGLIMMAVLCAASAAAFVLARRLQRMISDPVQHLADTARIVSEQRDYSVRAAHTSNDELGQLMDGFNEMLGQIQARDTELRTHREHLEEEVAKRTEELQNLNVDLTAARDRAEEASRAKTYFLANMSHEIRTPMTAIIGYADMMLEPDQTQSDRQDSLQIIRRSGRHLMDLINDILDISKIEAGRMTVERVGCDLPNLVVEVASLMRPRAAEKGLRFTVSSVGRIPQQIQTDSLRLRQILMNLASNAIKFTKDGQIDLVVSCIDAPAAQNADDPAAAAGASGRLIQIELRDTGIGMTPEQMGRLFQPFTQADESMTRRFGGTGLGLVISKRLARLLGGDITVTSRPGTGSTFTVTVEAGSLDGVPMITDLSESILCPFGGEVQEEAPVAPRVVRLGGRILLAEDGLDNQRLISTHLRKAGAEVVIAENGRIAVDLIDRDKQHFDLIIMDMQMPQLDGYGAASELRNKGYTLPIVALTAHAMAEDRAACLRAGCTDYLTKPVDKMVLLSTIRSYLQQLGVLIAPPSSSGSVGPDAGVQPAAAESSPEPVTAPAPTAPPADAGPKILRSEFATDPDMQEVILEFVKGLPAQVDRLQNLLAEGNLTELRRAVHQLKGAGGGYGFPQISHVALRAEEHVKSGAPLDQITSQVERLVRLVRQVQGYDDKPASTTPQA